MNALQNWRDALPTGERLYRLIALSLIVILALGLFLFVMLSLLPSVRNRSELIEVVATSEANLAAAQTAQARVPEQVRNQIDAAQTRVGAAGQLFLSEPQAAQALNRFYQYAQESGVTLAEMTDQTGAQATDASIYTLRTFGLRVTGTLPRLTNFLARIRESTLQGFVVSDVNITAGEDQSTALLKVDLYVSPAGSDTTPPASDGMPPLLPPLPDVPGPVTLTPAYTATVGLPPNGDSSGQPTGCTNLLLNSGFENDDGWLMGQAIVPAQFVTSQHYAGARALQLGYPPDMGAVNQGGYSSSRQLVTIPADASVVTLRWWHLYGTQESPVTEPNDAVDRHEVMLLTPDEQILAPLQRMRRNDTGWQEATVDLTSYRGQTFYVYFNVFNDENSIPTWMYIDEVRLEACAAVATPTPPLVTALPTVLPTALATAIPTALPTAIPTAIPTVLLPLPTLPVATATLGITPSTPTTALPSPTGGGSCGNQVINGGFEGEGGWLFGQAAAPGIYTTDQRYEGARSLQLGYPPAWAGENRSSYSSVRQPVTIPLSAGVATLRWWQLAGTQEASTTNPGTTSDRQEVLLLKPDETVLAILQRVRRSDAGWQQATIDLSAYRGQTIILYFNVFNDGNHLRTWLYADDVRLEFCPPGTTPVPTLTTPVAPTPTHTPIVIPTIAPTIVIPTVVIPTVVIPTIAPTIIIPTIVVPSLTPTPSPTGMASCTNLLVNAGFEGEGGWLFGQAVLLPAQYVTSQKYEGARSMQFGSPPDALDPAVSSYSSIRQQVTIPADASIVKLRWWQLSGTQESVTANPDVAGDRQEVLLLKSDETTLAIVQRVRNSDAGWQQATVDLTTYRGQTIYLYFNVYNDNNGLRTWMYVDDVHLELCSPSGTPVATPVPIITLVPSACMSDTYNCADFSPESAAQQLFDYCVSLGYGDIHGLDFDNDNIACEEN